MSISPIASSTTLPQTPNVAGDTTAANQQSSAPAKTGGAKGGGGGGGSSSDSTTVSNVTQTTNADGTITVVTTYADGSTSQTIEPNPTPVSNGSGLLNNSNSDQLATLLGAQEQSNG